MPVLFCDTTDKLSQFHEGKFKNGYSLIRFTQSTRNNSKIIYNDNLASYIMYIWSPFLCKSTTWSQGLAQALRCKVNLRTLGWTVMMNSLMLCICL